MSIAKALVKAKRSGVDVKVILDKSQIKKQHKIVRLFESESNQGNYS